MELITEPDLYSPSINDAGNYVDKIPSFNNIKHGLRCACGSRKDKTYDTHSIFASHIKTKKHQSWLVDLNLNKTNFYLENISLKNTITNQQLIIAKMENDINNRTMTIDYLTKQIVSNSTAVNDLLDFD
uniref:Uncharacterized protein n=1 Tax=viral metagenome TaxID=1070528 RepID=A0A6C0DKP5_9ZZZZ